MGMNINWPSELELLDPIQIGDHLTLFPLAGGGDAPPCVTLEEAQAKGQVVIEEQAEGEAVREIDLTVLGLQHVLVLEGELLEGALQNRVINMSLLLAPGKHKVPVNCVESGRWRSKRMTRNWYAEKSQRRRHEREFEATGTSLDTDIRRQNLRSSVASMRRYGRADADQCNTWSAIEAKMQAAEFQATDGDLLQLHESRWHSVDDLLKDAHPQDRQVGVVVAVGGRVVAMELLADAHSWRKVWRKLTSGYVGESMDHRGHSKPVSKAAALRFARAAAAAPWQATPCPVGEGVHETIEGQLTGFRLRDGDTVRHAVIFAT